MIHIKSTITSIIEISEMNQDGIYMFIDVFKHKIIINYNFEFFTYLITSEILKIFHKGILQQKNDTLIVTKTI